MYKLYCRVYQNTFRAGSVALPWRRPSRLGGYKALVALLRDRGINSVLIVTDKGLTALGLHEELVQTITQSGITTSVYDNTAQNPTIDNIEEALVLYKAEECTAIIALGGGSPMDCAKGVGARVARPKKSVESMRGLYKVLLKMPLFIAIPTTAGSGSETTVAAVVVDSRTGEKFAINDTALIPHYVLHDPRLTIKLPPAITATTGMDALCHAVEAYIGHSNTCRTELDAIKAVRLIFNNLHTAYQDGNNLQARTNMQKAAYLAGAAFTRAYVGNIHAISHTLSGQYDTPHGLANAVIMPYVLDVYGKTIEKRLWELAIAAGIAGLETPKNIASRQFIDTIRKMNREMNIPDKIADLKLYDIPKLANHALKEANPLYPVPVIFGYNDMVRVYHKLLV